MIAGVALAMLLIVFAAIGVTINDHRTRPERRIVAGERRLRWEARQ